MFSVRYELSPKTFRQSKYIKSVFSVRFEADVKENSTI